MVVVVVVLLLGEQHLDVVNVNHELKLRTSLGGQ